MVYGVSINGGSPSWMVCVRENPMKMDENWGYPISGNLHLRNNDISTRLDIQLPRNQLSAIQGSRAQDACIKLHCFFQM